MTRSRWRPWAWPSELRRCGILGINRRNAEYVLPANPRRHYPEVDDKLITKRICERRGIPVPQTYAVVEGQAEAHRILLMSSKWQEFVIKPARGARGRGIMVVTKRQGQTLVTAGGETLLLDAVGYHLSTILAGCYSLNGQPDRAIIEQRIVQHPIFQEISVGGTADIRVILYRRVPVMAMVRFPTRASLGRANLHQGAVGAGVDLISGQTFGGVCKSRAVTVHPDTGRPIAGLKIPHWKKLLTTAVLLGDSLRMGYLGVDFVVDARRGPVVLEANARPGLSLQVANRAGLLHRLKRIDAEARIPRSAERRLELAATLAQDTSSAWTTNSNCEHHPQGACRSGTAVFHQLA